GEYIPFYFGSRMPMLFVIQRGYNLVKSTHPQDIVYCITNVQAIIDTNLEYIFTDGHAVDLFSTQYGPEDIEKIDTLLDMKAVKAKYWKDENDLDLKRRKEAEFLVLGDIPIEKLKGYLVFNEISKSRLLKFGVEEAAIHISPQSYF
ncbi:MAG: DUF4433 domain-containing protein, partial [Bacteroidota bacterium]|nr:DUF4433 domain-containing protein [Bacteroidota bacterium]